MKDALNYLITEASDEGKKAVLEYLMKGVAKDQRRLMSRATKKKFGDVIKRLSKE